MQQTRSEAIGADLNFVAMGIYAALGREHDLCAALMSAKMDIHVSFEVDVTHTGIVHEYVKPLLLCKKGFNTWLDR